MNDNRMSLWVLKVFAFLRFIIKNVPRVLTLIVINSSQLCFSRFSFMYSIGHDPLSNSTSFRMSISRVVEQSMGQFVKLKFSQLFISKSTKNIFC